MLSDYLFTGVAAGAAMLGVGLLAHALPANSDALEDVRRALMVLLAAFVEGLGVLAVVYGLLVAFAGTTSAGGLGAALLVLIPAAALGIPAALLARPGDREGVRASMMLMLAFIGGLAVLAVMVALMTVLISDTDASGFDAITVLATVLVAAAAIGIGVVGSRALEEMGGDAIERGTVDVAMSRSRAVLTSAILEGVAVISLCGPDDAILRRVMMCRSTLAPQIVTSEGLTRRSGGDSCDE